MPKMAEYLSAFLNFFKPDERFIMHRYQSSRFALVVMVVTTAVWLEYEFFVNDQMRWDLLIILSASAIAKFGSMIYYRLKQ
jgi:low affinity Fe/Cu permease